MYNCKYCNKEYKDKGNLRKHEKYEHEESAYTETCPYCNNKLMPGRVSFHVSRCRKNPRRTPTPCELRYEEQKRQELAPGNCSYCGKYCHNQNSLRSHQRLCKMNPDRQYTIMNSVEFQNEMRSRIDYSNPWNKGLTADKDERVRHLASSIKEGIQKSMKEHPERFTGMARTEEAENRRRQQISSSIRQNPTCGGKRHGSGRGKKGWYKGFFCDSTYELAYVIYNLDNNIEFKRCDRVYTYTYENKQHKYYPDFELADGTLIETKGYHSDIVDAKTASVTDRSIIVLYKKDLAYAFDWVKDRYQFNNISDLYE